MNLLSRYTKHVLYRSEVLIIHPHMTSLYSVVERLMRTLMTGTKMLSTFSLRREINAWQIVAMLVNQRKLL